jgi:hypothetical protein
MHLSRCSALKFPTLTEPFKTATADRQGWVFGILEHTVSEPKICPKCGRPQQWKLWRHCPCGFDFGHDPSIPEVPAAQVAATKIPEIDGISRLGCTLALIFGGICLALAIVWAGCAYSLRGL